MFGQKQLSREGGIEIVVKELCTRMARDSQSDKLKLKGRTSKTYPLYETLVNTRDDLKRAYRGSKTAVKNTLFYLDKNNIAKADAMIRFGR